MFNTLNNSARKIQLDDQESDTGIHLDMSDVFHFKE